MDRQRIEAAYDHIAAEYAALSQMPPNLVEMATRFLGRLGLGARVLDIGCGDGLHMTWMEGRGFQATGIDLSAGMLEQARARGVRGELLQMDMCHLTLPPASFEGVWCCASLLHVPKAQAPLALEQMRCVLVPGGTLYLGLQKGSGEKWEVTRFAGVERFFARYTPEEAEELLAQAGFSVDECHQDEAGPGRSWLNILATAAL